MFRWTLPLIGGVLCSLTGSAAESIPFPKAVADILESRCTTCHGSNKPKAGISLTAPPTAAAIRIEAATWFRVLDQIEAGSMPPKGREPLSPAEKQALTQWVRGPVAAMLAQVQVKEGRAKFRRLNREEYANTIEDLFGFRPPVRSLLPADGRVDGYNKVALALPLSADGAEGYTKLAEWVVDQLLKPTKKTKQPQEERTYRLWAAPSEQSKGHILELPDGTMVSFNTDNTSGPLRLKGPKGNLVGFSIRVPGIHKLRLSVYGYQTDKPLPFGIYAGKTGSYPQEIDLVKALEAAPGKPTVIETELYLKANEGFRLIPFGLGVPVPKNHQAKHCKKPGLAVQWVDVEEPERPFLGDRWLSADFPPQMLDSMINRNQYAVLGSKAFPVSERGEYLKAVRATFARIGPRFYRRALTSAELDMAVANVARRLDAKMTMRSAFMAEVESFLTSPDFLCVIEKPGPLDDYALASRLAYFLWNSTPDEQLLEIARQGKLSDPKVLREQTDRLLQDPRSERFVADFTDQWLGLHAISDTTPDSDLYPGYDDLLKASSLMETRGSFRRILDQNRSVQEFVAPKWAWLNERLAKHYGIPDVSGVAMREVELPAGSPYGGLWTHSATMKVTANGTITSPVKRGVWVAERLLGIPIPPPPPDIEPVNPDTRGAKTLREQLALHRSSGACALCHAKFDPYGFALESFDVTGQFRTRYRVADPEVAKLPPNERKKRPRWTDGLPVDASGMTPDGRAFSGITELRQMLAANPRQLAYGVTRHLLTYSTGIPAGPADHLAIEAIVRRAETERYGLRALVHALVQSEVFRMK